MKESTYTKQALPEWQEKHPNARVMRNNTGVAWVGEPAGKQTISQKAGLVIRLIHARIIRFGIGLKNKKGNQVGGGDWIGWESFTLCKILSSIGEMDKNPVCKGIECKECKFNMKIAVFLNLEIKSKNGKETPEQIKFRKMVIEAGGISEILQEGKDNV